MRSYNMLFWALFVLAVASEIKFAQTAPDCTRISTVVKTQDDVSRLTNCIKALQDGRYGKRSSYDNFDNNLRNSRGNSLIMEENSNSNQDLLQEFYDYLRKINA